MSGPALVAPSKDPVGLFSIHLEEQILAATESIPEDAFPELKMAYPVSSCQLKLLTGVHNRLSRLAFLLTLLEMRFRMFNAFVVSASLTPSTVSPVVATTFAILAWRAISVSGRVPISGGENIIAHFVDTEIINHRFLYPNWIGPRRCLTLLSARRRLPTSSFTITDRLFGTAVQLAKNL
ncbi:hypothetical protein B0H13DRAFT_2364915 [Mycena leptocephala]|nr:hypothetical protein B0H13DRAFT_2364915 [Mycena leptocephala]